MFSYTGGPFTGEPSPGKTYYMPHKHDEVFTKGITSTTLPTAAGTYALIDDLVLTEDWTAPEGATTICLRDCTFSLYGFTIIIPEGSTLTICNCRNSENIAIVDMSDGGQLTGEGTMTEVGYSYTITNETTDTATSDVIDNTTNYIVTLPAAPEKIEVYVGETKLTADRDYTYDAGTLTIFKAAITGNLTIKIPPEPTVNTTTTEKRYNLAPSYPTVLFDTNGGTPVSPLTRAFGTAVNLPRYTTAKEGYIFTGWFLDKDCTVPARSFKLTGSVILYAGWLADTPETDAAAGE